MVPTSTSVVVLRVGARLQLRCTDHVLSWSKDGVRLRDGFKYSIGASMLTVRHTGTRIALSLSLSLSLSLCVSLSLCLFLCLSVSLSIYLSLELVASRYSSSSHIQNCF